MVTIGLRPGSNEAAKIVSTDRYAIACGMADDARMPSGVNSQIAVVATRTAAHPAHRTAWLGAKDSAIQATSYASAMTRSPAQTMPRCVAIAMWIAIGAAMRPRIATALRVAGPLLRPVVTPGI